VVIIGGYSVVPSQRVLCVPAELQSRVLFSNEPDGFVVWNDDVYGDVDFDSWPELPVSRVPDARSLAFMKQLVETSPPTFGSNTEAGLRNYQRPFADVVYRDAFGNVPAMQTSTPTVSATPPELAGDFVYLMLHGDARDGTQFIGEQTVPGDYVVAMTLDNVPRSRGAIVLAGACWGALTVSEPAYQYRPNRGVTIAGSGAPIAGLSASQFFAAQVRDPSSSLALKFLANGASAFVGCTASHYSPSNTDYDCNGRPMHENFWRAILSGSKPARALLQAKQQYALGLPHVAELSDAQSQAIEYKTLWSFTCLGVGC
jgi:hypothetical protein